MSFWGERKSAIEALAQRAGGYASGRKKCQWASAPRDEAAHGGIGQHPKHTLRPGRVRLAACCTRAALKASWRAPQKLMVTLRVNATRRQEKGTPQLATPLCPLLEQRAAAFQRLAGGPPRSGGPFWLSSARGAGGRKPEIKMGAKFRRVRHWASAADTHEAPALCQLPGCFLPHPFPYGSVFLDGPPNPSQAVTISGIAMSIASTGAFIQVGRLGSPENLFPDGSPQPRSCRGLILGQQPLFF